MSTFLLLIVQLLADMGVPMMRQIEHQLEEAVSVTHDWVRKCGARRVFSRKSVHPAAVVPLGVHPHHEP